MKNIALTLLSAAVIGSGLFVTFPTFAEEKTPKSEKPAKKSVLTLPGAKGNPDRVFILVEDAKLTLDGEKARLGDIKAGIYVGGRAKRISETKVEAHTIKVKSKAPERKKPAKKEDS